MGPYDQIDTPSLIVDLDVVERNVFEMAEVVRQAGVALRPHVKTHKAPEIARMQLDAGARGITVAKLGEAEVMADAGLDDILIAYPIGELKLERLAALMDRAEVRVSLDTIDVAEGLGRVGVRRGVDVPVLVEVDTGLHRMGRPPGEPRRRWRSRSRAFPGSTWSVCSPTRAIPTMRRMPPSFEASRSVRRWTCWRRPNDARAWDWRCARSAWDPPRPHASSRACRA